MTLTQRKKANECDVSFEISTGVWNQRINSVLFTCLCERISQHVLLRCFKQNKSFVSYLRRATFSQNFLLFKKEKFRAISLLQDLQENLLGRNYSVVQEYFGKISKLTQLKCNAKISTKNTTVSKVACNQFAEDGINSFLMAINENYYMFYFNSYSFCSPMK